MTLNSKAFVLLFIISIVPCAIQAKTYKCVADDGSITYSQTACASDQAVEKVIRGGQKKQQSQQDCKYAGQFAQSAAKKMRAGLDSEQTFNQYGGLDALSKSSLAIINYVYTYKNNSDVSLNRIGSLVVAKCHANSFGAVSCSDLPEQFQKSIFSCDEEQQKIIQQQRLRQEQLQQQYPTSLPVQSRQIPDTPQTTVTQDTNESLTDDCKKQYDERIRRIDDRLRESNTASESESLRAEKRRLRDTRYKECR